MQTFLRFRFTFSIVACQLVLMGVNFGALAQEFSQFEVLDSPSDEESYRSALAGANLEPYRFQDVDRILTFDSDVRFKLSSAQSLADSGAEIAVESYSHSSSVNKAITLVFRIAPNGGLGITTELDPDSKLARIGTGFPTSTKKTISQAEFDQLPEAKQAVILANPDKYIIQ